MTDNVMDLHLMLLLRSVKWASMLFPTTGSYKILQNKIGRNSEKISDFMEEWFVTDDGQFHGSVTAVKLLIRLVPTAAFILRFYFVKSPSSLMEKHC